MLAVGAALATAAAAGGAWQSCAEWGARFPDARGSGRCVAQSDIPKQLADYCPGRTGPACVWADDAAQLRFAKVQGNQWAIAFDLNLQPPNRSACTAASHATACDMWLPPCGSEDKVETLDPEAPFGKPGDACQGICSDSGCGTKKVWWECTPPAFCPGPSPAPAQGGGCTIPDLTLPGPNRLTMYIHDVSALLSYWVYVPLGAGPWPVFLFGHGLGGHPSDYNTVLPLIASHGFIIVAPADGPYDKHDKLMGARHWVEAQNQNTTSPLKGKIRGDYAMGGHSMGGINTCVAAGTEKGFDSLVRAIIPMHGHAFQPWGRRADMKKITVPILMTAGQNDSVVAPGGCHSAWNEVPAPGLYLELRDASHYSSVVNTREVPAVVAFLRLYLNNDTQCHDTVWGTGPGSLVADQSWSTTAIRAPPAH
eukprot:TRINITY_DN4409_c0_g6_i1.p1 TRINITY_DN4409_c0_g6~~TRINITY_DN4409_c0_g6_i1.p1  ORF type:complete len:423 (+),score=120.46 TRINITY_DN4409_c0_g6_i1:91-1359(+)